jgi:DNA-binding Lrp family transcriptional regulator
MSDDAETPVKIVLTLVVAKRPLGLGEIAKASHLSKSLVIYHLRKLIDDGIVIQEETRYSCQPFLLNEHKEDLAALTSVMVNLVTRDLVIEEGLNVEELGRCVLRNLDMYLQLYKEGLFD